jgi:hypothetical protein
MADEKFFAWLDGELIGAEAAEVEARVAADPALQKLADEHRALGAQLRAAFDPIAEQPVSIDAYAPTAANVASLAEARNARTRPFVQQPWAQAAAIALVFVTGLAAGNSLSDAPTGPVVAQDGQLIAAAALDNSLNMQLASQVPDGARIGVTFRDKQGNICRSFTDSAASGLACREGGNWQVEAIFRAPEGQDSDYRMAAGADPRLATLIETRIFGEPFDAAQERQSRDTGWK